MILAPVRPSSSFFIGSILQFPLCYPEMIFIHNTTFLHIHFKLFKINLSKKIQIKGKYLQGKIAGMTICMCSDPDGQKIE